MARTLSIAILAIDNASKTLDDISARAAATGETLNKSSGSLAGFAATAAKGLAITGLAAAAVGVEAVKMASTFQSQMEKISTLASVPQSSLASLSSGVLDLAGKTGTDPDSLAAALYHVESSFASTGITGAKALQILKIGAEGAKIGGADLNDVMNALDAAVVSGIPGVQNISAAMGGLLKIVGAGDMTMQDFADAASTGILATAKVYGASLSDVGAALATFGDNNIRGQNAATDLRMSIMDLTKQTPAGAAALAKIGLKAGELSKDMQTGGLNKAMSDLYTHLQDAGDGGVKMGAVLENAFTKKSSAPLAILLSQFDRFQSKYAEMDNGANSFAAAWSKTKNTLSQQWSQIEDGAKSLGVRLGEALIPKVSAGISKVEGLFARLKSPLSDFMDGMTTGDTTTSSALANIGGNIRDFFTTVAGGSGAVQDTTQGVSRLGILLHGAFLDAIGSAKKILPDLWLGLKNIWTVIQPLTPALGAIVMAFSGLAKQAAALGPIIKSVTGFLAAHKVVVDAIVIAIGGAVLVWKAWTLAIEAWALITKAAAAAQVAFNLVMDANPVLLIATAVLGLGAALYYAYTHSKTFRNIINDIGGALKKVWTDVLRPVVGFFSNDLPKAFDAFIGFFTTTVPHAFDTVVSFFKDLPGNILSALGDAGKWLLGIGKDAATGLLHGLQSAFVTLPRDLYRWIVTNGGLIGIGNKLMVMLASGLRAGWSKVVSFFEAAPGVILNLLKSAGSWLLGVGKTLIVGWWNGITAEAKTVWSFFTGLPARIEGYAADAHEWLFVGGKNILVGAWNGIKTGATDVWKFFTDLPGTLAGYAAKADTWLVQMGKDIVTGIIHGIESMAGDVGKGLKTLVTGALHGLGKLGSGAAKLLGLATGGLVPGAIGTPVPAIVHGGEYMLSRGMLTGKSPIDPSVAQAVMANLAKSSAGMAALSAQAKYNDTASAMGTLPTTSSLGSNTGSGKTIQITQNIYGQSDPVGTANAAQRRLVSAVI